jgi:plasmid stabilization system protein ParE
MAFRVELAPEALADLDAIAVYIQERGSFVNAERWFNGIVDAIRSLDELPTRCPVAAESQELQTEIRLLLHGKRHRQYKIYFAIHHDSGTVRVFHVRHWARKPLTDQELNELIDDAEDLP